MVDLLMETEEDGKKLSSQEIVDLIIIYLLAGHESFAHASTWVLINLLEHPQYYQIAKEEQEEIVKKRVSTEDALNLAEIKEMEYLSKVIDETLRVANLSFTLFREAKTDVHMNGYTIPKGWKVLPWIRSVHMDSQNYKNPNVFNPSRCKEDNPSKGAGMYMPFGAGSRLCPGMNLAKIEICIFLHYFLLHYKLERLNPNGKVTYIPVTRPSDNCIARIQKLSST
ncbi:Ent-kaurenoic acid oxidase 2 [Heracleum sosnowskyi]|uniref:Ent-kaurenoic acid oxidase 2 n=1 Tax=Heracleum sosnowskyi TaxID=360622 RepID=A0AAD8GZ24_9APIA|nr:Ent-kaurenoic acid oxidase 2 [Heracleum sosnowskyi]